MLLEYYYNNESNIYIILFCFYISDCSWFRILYWKSSTILDCPVHSWLYYSAVLLGTGLWLIFTYSCSINYDNHDDDDDDDNDDDELTVRNLILLPNSTRTNKQITRTSLVASIGDNRVVQNQWPLVVKKVN